MITDGIMEESRRSRLAEFYRAYAPEAVRFAYLLTGDRLAAEDLVQEALIRLFGRFGHLRDENHFRLYLRKTILNLVRMQARHERVTRAAPIAIDGQSADFADDVVARTSVFNGLMLLPPKQRAAVVCRYYLDLSEKDTADLLKCRQGTVKSLLSRAVSTLKKMEVL